MADTLESFDRIEVKTGDQINWAAPRDVPWMVADVCDTRLGVCASLLSDGEYHAACVAALDAMPEGKAAVVAEVEMTLRTHAIIGGWHDYTIDPATGRYVWE